MPRTNSSKNLSTTGGKRGAGQTKSKATDKGTRSSETTRNKSKAGLLYSKARSSERKVNTGKSAKRYKVGEYLVYPMHGVGRVVSVSRQTVLGKAKSYYVLEIESNKMKVMVPVENVAKIGIRSVISRRQITSVINLLKKEEVDTEEDWKLRYQNNMNKIKSGDIYSIAEVCRNLYKRARDKELSLMERRLYESAYRLISTEIALSKSVSLEEAGNMISEVLA